MDVLNNAAVFAADISQGKLTIILGFRTKAQGCGLKWQYDCAAIMAALQSGTCRISVDEATLYADVESSHMTCLARVRWIEIPRQIFSSSPTI